jgi:hypothetical protein
VRPVCRSLTCADSRLALATRDLLSVGADTPRRVRPRRVLVPIRPKGKKAPGGASRKYHKSWLRARGSADRHDAGVGPTSILTRRRPRVSRAPSGIDTPRSAQGTVSRPCHHTSCLIANISGAQGTRIRCCASSHARSDDAGQVLYRPLGHHLSNSAPSCRLPGPFSAPRIPTSRVC